MKCPFCSCADTQVVDSRVSEEGDTIRRRRRCTACERRFTTYERVDLMMPAIVKRNGTRVEFDPAKLHGSMSLALRKRPVSATAGGAAVAR
ncbi:MAG: transcriptional regulator NrdR, partial [Castellaniella sp.]